MSPLFHVPTCFKVSSVANVNFKWGHTKIALQSIFKRFESESKLPTETKVSKQCFL